MKKWRYCILLAAMALCLLFPLQAAGETRDSVRITSSGGQADIALRLPEGKYEKITSLRLKLVVAEERGAIVMDEGQVTLNESNVRSRIQEVFVDKIPVQDLGEENLPAEGGGKEAYLVDILLSGEEDLFEAQREEDTYVDICSLTVASKDEKTASSAVVTVYDNAYEIVNRVGSLSVIQVPQVSGVLEIPGKGEDEGQIAPPPATVTPAPIFGSGEAAPPLASTTESSLPEASPTPAAASFNRKKAGVLSGKGKNRTKRVSLSWEPIEGAKGYQIQVYNRSAQRYMTIKTIKNPKTTRFTTKDLRYGIRYRFRMRAFAYGEKGQRVYGKYSKSIFVMVGPGPGAIRSLTSPEEGTVSLSWKKPRGAAGYQISMADSKDGDFHRVKTIVGGNTTSCLLTGLSSQEERFFRIRAFVKDKNGKRTYGSFSPVRAVTVR